MYAYLGAGRGTKGVLRLGEQQFNSPPAKRPQRILSAAPDTAAGQGFEQVARTRRGQRSV
jgi:hypothetical protein